MSVTPREQELSDRLVVVRRALESAHATLSTAARVLRTELPELAGALEAAATRADTVIRADYRSAG